MSERLGLRVTGPAGAAHRGDARGRCAGGRRGASPRPQGACRRGPGGPAWRLLRACARCSAPAARTWRPSTPPSRSGWPTSRRRVDPMDEPETLGRRGLAGAATRGSARARGAPAGPGRCAARAGAGRLVRRGAAAREGLRRVHGGREAAGAPPDGPARRVRAHSAAAGACARPPRRAAGRRSPRPEKDYAQLAALRGRSRGAPLAAPGRAAPATRARVRRVRDRWSPTPGCSSSTCRPA